jgi:serine/threonine protein kinase/formylglycine-generating enzyme required for sulfatase activity
VSAPGPELEDVIAEYLDRRARGEVVRPSEYLERYPELRQELARHFETLEALDSLALAEPAYPSASQHIGDYRLVRVLGRGSMGVVYLAEHATTGATFALKVLGSPLTQTVESRERFRREGQVAMRLRHPNLIAVHAHGESQGYPYYVMDLVAGPTLSQVLRRMRELAEDGIAEPDLAQVVAELSGQAAPPPGATQPDRFELAAQLVAEIADALQCAHDQGVIHRDVKPQNILLGPDLTPRLGDFGLAKDAAQSSLSRTGLSVGTPCYMSPEMVRAEGERIDHRTDVYSLGATLHELMTLEVPFQAGSVEELFVRITEDDPPALGRSQRQVPRPLQAIAWKALEKRPERRYESCAAMAEDLRRFVRGEPVVARLPSAPARLARALRRRRSLVLGFAACGAVALTAAWIASRPAEARATELVLTAEADLRDARVEARPLGRLGAPLAAKAQDARRWRVALSAGEYLVTARASDGRIAERQVKIAAGAVRQAESLGVPFDAATGPEGMVLVPGGPYAIGFDPEPGYSTYARKARRVEIAPFWIDRCEVSNEQYARFLAATGRSHPTWPDNKLVKGSERRPVQNVTWADAMAYAEWAKRRLPTDIEWEVAGRGPEGTAYPWGDELAADARFANLGRPRTPDDPLTVRLGRPCEVDKETQDRSVFDVLHLVGNVREWVADPWTPREAEDPAATAADRERGWSLGQRTLRGASYAVVPGSNCRLSERKPASDAGARRAEPDAGFRCALSAVQR